MSSKEYDDKMVGSHIGAAMERLQGAAKAMWEEGKFNGPEVHGKFKHRRPSPLLYSYGTQQEYLVNILRGSKKLLEEVKYELREAVCDLSHNIVTMDHEEIEDMKNVIQKLSDLKAALSNVILTTPRDDRHVFTVRCIWNIGHEGVVFRSSGETYRWLMDNKALKEYYKDGLLCKQSIDDLMEEGILEIDSLQVPWGISGHNC